MGALLAGSLIIIPAAVGRRLTDNMSHFLIASSTAGVVSVGTGLLLSSFVFPRFGLGPTTIMGAAFLFAVCLLKKTLRVGRIAASSALTGTSSTVGLQEATASVLSGSTFLKNSVAVWVGTSRFSGSSDDCVIEIRVVKTKMYPSMHPS